MEGLNLFELLSYGAIGLGCILAVLAYFLLKNEQEQETIRQNMLTAIYVFMGFSTLLVLMGFVTEYYQESKVKRKLTTCVSDLSDIKQKQIQIEQRLTSAREVLTELMKQKEGKVDRLKQLQPSNPAYFALVNEIQADLARLDEGLEQAVKKLSLPSEDENE